MEEEFKKPIQCIKDLIDESSPNHDEYIDYKKFVKLLIFDIIISAI